ncbi:DUF3617 family protein [uncultured Brevundimonas sp.]|uniref:DUF3617 domain-containing protein n=1 Tax=uncultured Brevundimonas sp. TaxID=213418 RepID=UPI00262DE7BB|nr:DUF3617 family protein [uncultured Brevundimonas sp.]
MKKLVVLGAISFAALSVAACNPKAEDGKAADGAAPAAGAAAELEGPKPGLWRVTTAMEGVPGGASVPPQEVCITEAKFEAPSSVQAAGADCTTTPLTKQGDARVSTATCNLPNNMKSESTVKVSGDFASRYTTEVVTKINPAPAPGMGETKITMTAERIGDCPAA